MKNKNGIRTIWNATCAPFIVIGMVFGIFGFMLPEKECVAEKKQPDVPESNSVTHQYLIELVALLTIAVVLLWGVWNLIAEALEGGMIGGGIEFSLGVIELAGISMLLFFIVLPETMKTLRELGYIRSLSEIKRRLLNKYRLGY